MNSWAVRRGRAGPLASADSWSSVEPFLSSVCRTTLDPTASHGTQTACQQQMKSGRSRAIPEASLEAKVREFLSKTHRLTPSDAGGKAEIDLLIRVSLVRSQRGPPIESITYRDLGATVADGCHHYVTGPQTRRSLHSPAEDAFPTGCFVISRSAVRVRSPAPIKSITYRDSRNRRLRLCRHYVGKLPAQARKSQRRAATS